MRVLIVNGSVLGSSIQIDPAEQARVDAAQKDGYKLAVVSNAGLHHGKIRLTFLPPAAFIASEPGDQNDQSDF